MSSWIAIGIMSGTSIDGLDIVAVEIKKEIEKWSYNILKSSEVQYPLSLKNKLIQCIEFSAEQLIYLDLELGKFIGDEVNKFLEDTVIKPDIIASHGHTVFHQPDSGMTFQIGDGQTILNKTGIKTVCDFRKMDVLKGGQGAPLVPIGDALLFSDYPVCLNIGGFANISFNNSEGYRKAFDTGPANIILNYLTRKINKEYDPNGDMASSGRIITYIYDKLNEFPYYSLPAPKSLGLEWVKENFWSLLNNDNETIPDLLCTCVEHIAFQIDKSISDECGINNRKEVKVLVTGGGVYNDFLMNRLKNLSKNMQYIIPEPQIIDFKEALIFALLGVLRILEKENILSSVTGAYSNSIGGTIHDNS